MIINDNVENLVKILCIFVIAQAKDNRSIASHRRRRSVNYFMCFILV